MLRESTPQSSAQVKVADPVLLTRRIWNPSSHQDGPRRSALLPERAQRPRCRGAHGDPGRSVAEQLNSPGLQAGPQWWVAQLAEQRVKSPIACRFESCPITNRFNQFIGDRSDRPAQPDCRRLHHQILTFVDPMILDLIEAIRIVWAVIEFWVI